MNAKKLCLLATLLFASSLFAQSNTITCLPQFQPLPALPVIDRDDVNKMMKGTLYTVSEQVRMTTTTAGPGSTPACYPQWVRAYRKDAPSSWNPPSSTISEPTPGPLLRARVGDLVELTFLNMIDANKFPGSDDEQCDQTSSYPGTGPGADTYPDCFAGSVFTNVHYHGTHTNPNTTGDNVFLQIAPSPRNSGSNTPKIDPAGAAAGLQDFYTDCESQLKTATGPKMWPLYWGEVRDTTQKYLLGNVQNFGPKGWYDFDLTAIGKGRWPQYYASVFPYCFKLPEYTQTGWPPASQANMTSPHTHGAGQTQVEEAENPQRPLIMGQAPGTHWYHAHKHGSTTINVLNGMTGVFVIEGPYDDAINAYYGAGWTRKQPVMVVNQLGSNPPLLSGQRGAGPGPDFSVNGRLRPTVAMPGNSVQMWRLANTSSRGGIFLLAPTGIQWMQLAQDGVQFNNVNYQASKNQELLLTSGNRVDLLVKAPAYNPSGNNNYDVLCYITVDPSDMPPQNLQKFTPTTALKLLRVVVGPNGPTMNFMPTAPPFPAFLADITPGEVKGTKTLTYASSALPVSGARSNPPAHTIDGKKFDGQVGASVTLNQVEEWKIVNATYPPANGNQISHPFHIHINPFQIFEFFDPNSTISSTAGPGTVTTIPPTNPQTGNLQSQESQVNGSSETTFTSTFVVGDFIWINGEAPGQVVAIANDHSMTVNYPAGGVTNAAYTSAVPLYTINKATARANQCYLDPNNPDTWKPCVNTVPQQNAIWWDVFPIPSGNIFYANASTYYPIPGYFKMRSRFVDYFGNYVTHCHILAHEDRGMMTVVQVTPLQMPYDH